MLLPHWDDVDQATQALALGVGASELHGLLSGWLAAHGRTDRWLGEVLADDDPRLAGAAGDGALKALLQATQAGYGAGIAVLELLLPPETAALQTRSSAVFDWCRGFLGGFGLAGGTSAQLDEEGAEALQDIARLAAATPEPEEGEEEEAALAEIVEYLRIAAAMIHDGMPAADTARTWH